jgi:hypothetical protein
LLSWATQPVLHNGHSAQLTGFMNIWVCIGQTKQKERRRRRRTFGFVL